MSGKILQAATRLRASVHDVFPHGGGTLWRHTPLDERHDILKRFPHRTDLDVNAPFEGLARPAVRVDPAQPKPAPMQHSKPSSGIRAPKQGRLDFTHPKDD